MYFTRIASAFAVAATFCSLAVANPLPSIEKRQDLSSISGVLTTLQTTIGPILAEITSQGNGGNVTSDSLNPLVGELDTALTNAASSLTSLSTSSRVKRQSESDIATLTAGIVTDIANALNTLLGDASAIPELGSIFSGIDTSLNQVLVGLETLLAGVLNLVANLLTDVSGLLSQLALGLTLASLGL
ncbi:hypothetical protein SCHPADRAFT_884637 [Schizopora paradoxa]|uniref:DUF6987 domain-containing protein n=1 Tax=Schizopora paradoxa TaxID=27342 RepID=A0A0H2S8K2_9AGAM|nr:hypothetical protein SCHPADRAFT_884637 [Schizopora paradoxa]